MARLRLESGLELYYKDWGHGQPIVFSHGWPLSSDAFEDQMMFLASNSYRCIAHDRRGHGRSSQPWDGNNMDTYADDLAELINHLDLKNAILVGHSTGGGEVVRYIARHGTKRLKKAILIGAVPPLMIKGLPIEVFDQIRVSFMKDRSQFFKEIASAFYGNFVTEGLKESFWLQGMLGGLKNLYDCIKVVSETDQTEDLKKIDIPTLIIHGDADQIVSIKDSALISSKLIQNAELKMYKGAPHGLCSTHKDQINQDLLDFIKR